MESPFDVLQVDPDADEADIERAFRRRIKEVHPDQGGSVEEFRLVHAAREQLLARHLEDVDPSDLSVDVGGNGTEPVASTVQYLNFEVFEDYGWSLEDDDLFEKAAEADLDTSDYGRFLVEPSESVLEAAENRGFEWPYACRGGACANCAVAVQDGDLSTPVNHVLPDEMVDCGIRLSCVAKPTTDESNVIFNVKQLPELDELRLPPRPFE
ncbi:2Fe-2S iron-sulfur cluster-binding protein [Halobacteria archaeon AArc-curdl1]|uniref:2Fe-2S iron-sulfur cluster-binding protein n=1 Tax=Natronosalvus hydrolyticus TaxID=2979988 RepID=A0AAP3E4I6_9EURY|nr:2Fe-2S iron-sulfur cluster-binding protein [Halobacteria archaeon AArc-curdl1]